MRVSPFFFLGGTGMFSVIQAYGSENGSTYDQVSRPSLLINISEKAAQEFNGVTEKAARFGVGLDYEKAAERFVSIYNEEFPEETIKTDDLAEDQVVDTQIRLNSLRLCDIVGERLKEDPKSVEALNDLFSIELIMIANKWALAREEAALCERGDAAGARCSFVALTADPPHNGHTMMHAATYVVQGADPKGEQAPYTERVSLMKCGYEVDENTRKIHRAVAELREAGIDVRHATADTDGRVTELKYLLPGDAQEQVESIESLRGRYEEKNEIIDALEVLTEHFLENGESKYSRHVLRLCEAADAPAYFCGSDHAHFFKEGVSGKIDVLGHMALLAQQTYREIPVDINVRNRNEANLGAAIKELGGKVQVGLDRGEDIGNIELITGICNGESVKITIGDVVDRFGTENGTRVFIAISGLLNTNKASVEPSQLGRALLGLSPDPDSGEKITTVLNAFKTALNLDIRLCYPGYATSSSLIRELIKADSPTALAFLADGAIRKLSAMMEVAPQMLNAHGSSGPFGIPISGQIDRFLRDYVNQSTH
jgi:biotin operon repressor